MQRRRCLTAFVRHKSDGTTLIAAKDLKRNAVGFDLNEKYVEFANRRLAEQTQTQVCHTLSDETKQIEIRDDAINIPKYLEEETVSLCVTSPPYANMLNRERLNKSFRSDLRQLYQEVSIFYKVKIN